MDVASNPAMLALASILENIGQTGIARAETVRIQTLRAHNWRDSCLGAPALGEVCSGGGIPGFIIDLEGDVRYHTDERGGFRRVAKPTAETDIRVRFERDGGLVPSHVEFKAESATLSFEAEQDLRQLVEESDFFSLSSGVPGNSASAHVYTIWIAVGRRSHVVMLSENDAMTDPRVQPLLEWLTMRLPERGRGNVLETAML